MCNLLTNYINNEYYLYNMLNLICKGNNKEIMNIFTEFLINNSDFYIKKTEFSICTLLGDAIYNLNIVKNINSIIFLLRNFSNDQLCVDIVDLCGMTALDYAIRNNDEFIIKLLLYRGINKTNKYKHYILEDFLKNPNIIYEWNKCHNFNQFFHYNVHYFLYVIGTCDNYFVIKGNNIITRWFKILIKLPIELQMIICNYSCYIKYNFISSDLIDENLYILNL